MAYNNNKLEILTIEQLEKLESIIQICFERGERAGREAGFEAGVQFAQRWIPVDEELPEIGKDVLIINLDKNRSYKDGTPKQPRCNVTCRVLNKSTEGWRWLGVWGDNKVTHWRHIELE
jgi:hypothetical protein